MREGIGLFHASPRDPIWEYVLSLEQAHAGIDEQQERLALIGHSHVSLFFTRPEGRAGRDARRPGRDGALLDLCERRWLLNPGSVGQPRDGDPRAAWLELDTEERTARFHRVPYDIAAPPRQSSTQACRIASRTGSTSDSDAQLQANPASRLLSRLAFMAR